MSSLPTPFLPAADVTLPLTQTTLKRAVSCAGVGVHTGERVRVRLNPAPAGHGVVFVRSDVDGPDTHIAVRADAVSSATLSTVITNGAGVSVATIEHLMAALAALCVDNVLIEMDGSEVPIMDGSAAPFMHLIELAGLSTQAAPRRYVRVLKDIVLRDGVKVASLTPADALEVDCTIDFATPLIGSQHVALTVTPDSFRRELAMARTFGFAHEVEALRAQGLARGGSMDNCIVIEGDQVCNPEGLRFADEFVRHKALDAVGDLYVAGLPILGRYTSHRAGHALNTAVVRALMATTDAYEIISADERLHVAR